MHTIYCIPENFIEPQVCSILNGEQDYQFKSIQVDELYSGKIKFPQNPSFIFNLDQVKIKNCSFWSEHKSIFPYCASLGITSDKMINNNSHLLSLFGIDEVVNISTDVHKILLELCEKIRFISQVKKVHYDLAQKLKMGFIVGKSRTIRDLVLRLPRYANSDTNILILGETGTGKELFARAFHYLGKRAGKPFITIDCSTLPESLAENELFGHVRGSYTHAQSSSRGLLAEANEGTVFFDEIEALPYRVQSKLLRFIQEREYKPVGSSRYKQVNVRLITASNENLEQLVKQGVFRRDLFHRLHVAPICLPALRDRREDIPLLTDFFLKKLSYNKVNIDNLSPSVINRWLQYDWPGNIRELENRIQEYLLTDNDSYISQISSMVEKTKKAKPAESFEPLKEYRSRIMAKYENSYLQSLIQHTGGNISQAARIAQMNRKNFSLLLKKYGIT
jgi:DNA-binding NtrC family response regulator